jgi:hypothetical protein
MLSIVVLSFSIPRCYAGPCSKQIDEMQIRIDNKLNSAAAAGPSADESTAALLDRQPTPKSMAQAELKLGDFSAKAARAVEEAMARARQADLAASKAGCEEALADAQRALGN